MKNNCKDERIIKLVGNVSEVPLLKLVDLLAKMLLQYRTVRRIV